MDSRLFEIQKSEGLRRRSYIIDEAIQFKELEARSKLCLLETVHRQRQLTAGDQYLSAKVQLEHLAIDEHNERRFITSLLYQTTMLEWKAFYEKAYYQTLFLEKRNRNFNFLLTEYAEQYILRKRIGPIEEQEREEDIESAEQEERVAICNYRNRVGRAIEKRRIEDEETAVRTASLSVPEVHEIFIIFSEQKAQHQQLYFELFGRERQALESREAVDRGDIVVAQTEGNVFESVKSRMFLSEFRILCRNSIVSQHEQILSQQVFEVHGPAVEYIEERERVFVYAAEGMEWYQTIIREHEPVLRNYQLHLSAMTISRCAEGFKDRLSLFRCEYIDMKRRKRLERLDRRDASIVEVQSYLMRRQSAEISLRKKLENIATTINAYLRWKRDSSATTQLSYAKHLSSLTMLQRIGRAFFEREEIHELFLVTKQEEQQLNDRRNEAALTIQYGWKEFKDTQRRREKRKLDLISKRCVSAATAITKTVKMFILRRKFSKHRYTMALERSASLVQRTMRGARIRVFFHQMLYARVIQQFMRARFSAKHTIETFVTPSVVKIQCAYRCHLAREASRMQLARRSVAEEVMIRTNAALTVLRALVMNRYRAVRHRKRLLSEKQRTEAEIIAVQAHFEANKKRFDSLSDLWRIGKGYLGRKDTQRIVAKRSATKAFVLQFVQAYFSNKIIDNLVQLKQQSLVESMAQKRSELIQRFVLAAFSHYEVVVPKMRGVEQCHQEAQYAACLLQPIGRAHNSRQLVFQKLQETQVAACTIQRSVRCRQATEVLKNKMHVRAQERHINNIEDAKYKVGCWLVALIKNRRYAAMTIQLFYRRNRVQMSRNQRLREARESIFVIQRRELEKEARLQITTSVLRTESEEFQKIKRESIDAMVALGMHPLNQPKHNSELDEASSVAIGRREEMKRLHHIEAYLSVVRDLFVHEHRRLHILYHLSRLSTCESNEQLVRARISNEQLSAQRSTNIYHIKRVARIFETTYLANVERKQTSRRAAIVEAEAAKAALFWELFGSKISSAQKVENEIRQLLVQNVETVRSKEDQEVSIQSQKQETPKKRRPNIFSSVARPHEVTPVRANFLKKLTTKSVTQESSADTVSSTPIAESMFSVVAIAPQQNSPLTTSQLELRIRPFATFENRFRNALATIGGQQEALTYSQIANCVEDATLDFETRTSHEYALEEEIDNAILEYTNATNPQGSPTRVAATAAHTFARIVFITQLSNKEEININLRQHERIAKVSAIKMFEAVQHLNQILCTAMERVIKAKYVAESTDNSMAESSSDGKRQARFAKSDSSLPSCMIRSLMSNSSPSVHFDVSNPRSNYVHFESDLLLSLLASHLSTEGPKQHLHRLSSITSNFQLRKEFSNGRPIVRRASTVDGEALKVEAYPITTREPSILFFAREIGIIGEEAPMISRIVSKLVALNFLLKSFDAFSSEMNYPPPTTHFLQPTLPHQLTSLLTKPTTTELEIAAKAKESKSLRPHLAIRMSKARM